MGAKAVLWMAAAATTESAVRASAISSTAGGLGSSRDRNGHLLPAQLPGRPWATGNQNGQGNAAPSPATLCLSAASFNTTSTAAASAATAAVSLSASSSVGSTLPFQRSAAQHRSRRSSGTVGGEASVRCSASAGSGEARRQLTDIEKDFLLRAVELADSTAGMTAPHPNHGCVITSGSFRDGSNGTTGNGSFKSLASGVLREDLIVGEGYLYAQGCTSAEERAVSAAREAARGGTAFMNLEPVAAAGDCRAVDALIHAGISKVVVGLRHPLPSLAGRGISRLRDAGIHVFVLSEDFILTPDSPGQVALRACEVVNEALIYRAVAGRPFAVLKYAVTLDGKIAASTGHSAWVSSPDARAHVFATRARSDAVIVGGQTLRRDNPRLTTRMEGGQQPVRIVMSEKMELPVEANLWDVSQGATIVMTTEGVREDLQAQLRARGVEIVTFPKLTPASVMAYCRQRGFLQVLWECGGRLSAPAIRDNVIDKVIAFVCPKIVGGVNAPQPVGDLGIDFMYNALPLSDVAFRQVGPDMMVQGYLQALQRGDGGQLIWPHAFSDEKAQEAAAAMAKRHAESVAQIAARYNPTFALQDGAASAVPRPVFFYKAWDECGILSNFSAHPIRITGSDGVQRDWRSVEHFYQAEKFAGVDDDLARSTVEEIRRVVAPEEAARAGRRLAMIHRHLVRPDWEAVKADVMYTGLKAKFLSYSEAREALLKTGSSEGVHEAQAGPNGVGAASEDPTAEANLLELSPHDYIWGTGRDGSGRNLLGGLLVRLRRELQDGTLVPMDDISALAPTAVVKAPNSTNTTTTTSNTSTLQNSATAVPRHVNGVHKELDLQGKYSPPQGQELLRS